MRHLLRRVCTASAAVTGLLVVAGCGPVASVKGDQPVTLQVSWHKGQTVRYHTQYKFVTKDPSAAKAETTEGSGNLTFTVLSVDSQGTARVQISSDHVTNYLNGKKQTPSADSSKPVIIDISRDGKVKVEGKPDTSGYTNPFNGAFGGVFGMPGATPSSVSNNEPFQFFPNGKVKPGTTWTSTYDYPSAQQPAVAGLKGTLHAQETNKFTGYETVQGAQYAVVDSSAAMPVNLTFDLAAYLKAMAPKNSNTNAESAFSTSKPILIKVGGNAGWHVKSAIDTRSNELYSFGGHGDVKIALSFSGFQPTTSSNPGSSSISVDGDFSLQRI